MALKFSNSYYLNWVEEEEEDSGENTAAEIKIKATVVAEFDVERETTRDNKFIKFSSLIIPN